MVYPQSYPQFPTTIPLSPTFKTSSITKKALKRLTFPHLVPSQLNKQKLRSLFNKPELYMPYSLSLGNANGSNMETSIIAKKVKLAMPVHRAISQTMPDELKNTNDATIIRDPKIVNTLPFFLNTFID